MIKVGEQEKAKYWGNFSMKMEIMTIHQESKT